MPGQRAAGLKKADTLQKVCGIDEAGRGPLAGPVIAACVFIPEEKADLPFWNDVTDSKKLSAKKRESLFGYICDHALLGTGQASVHEIDGLNIHHATLLAMRRACEAMNTLPDHALIDGKFVPPSLPCTAETVVGGDGLYLCIAAASIVAKVTRDRIMIALHEKFPAYGWFNNAGYGTVEHLAALAEHGPTPHHRKSFSPVKQYLMVSS